MNNDYYYYDSSSYPLNSVLSSNGKCFYCQYELSDKCLKCRFTNDKLMCTLCKPGYYLDSEGKCISYMNKIKIIPNCKEHIFKLKNYTFYYYLSSKNKTYYVKSSNYNSTEINDHLRNLNSSINTTCQECQEEYFLNDKGECEILNLENCTGNFINQNIGERLYKCDDLCSHKEYPNIYIELKNNNSNNSSGKDIKSLYDVLSYLYLDEFNNEIKNNILKSKLCYNISNEEIKYEGCNGIIYDNKTGSYQCIVCKYGYILDKLNHICFAINHNNKYLYCDFENIGNKSHPIYSCKGCYNDYTLVTFENGIKGCIYDESLNNCIEVNTISDHINHSYNCKSCIQNYLPYNSSYYNRTICQNVFENITTSQNISLEIFNSIEYIPADVNGKCKNSFFTPDGKKCFKCNNKNVGMPGCKNNCSFSLHRNNPLLCLSGCKEEDGYIESSKGICETCDSINKGCYKCHYEENYPNNYFGLKLKRRFQCDICESGYILSKDGRCFKCSYLDNCKNCIQNETTGNFKCIECSNHYFLNEKGYCERCILNKEIINNKCIECDDVNKGGIENCYLCKKNTEENGLLCKECKEGYILYNNTCLKMEKFDSKFEMFRIRIYK